MLAKLKGMWLGNSALSWRIVKFAAVFCVIVPKLVEAQASAGLPIKYSELTDEQMDIFLSGAILLIGIADIIINGIRFVGLLSWH
jgi:hypothetical protein